MGVTDGTASAASAFTWLVTAPPPPVDENRAPVCSAARPSVAEIWPPNHKKRYDVGILGVTDPDGDRLQVRITGIVQDEPTNR